MRESWAWTFLRSPWFCAWLVFTLNTTAYTTEIFAGALRATPAGELEAARACGLSEGAIYRRILLPSALRSFGPAYPPSAKTCRSQGQAWRIDFRTAGAPSKA